MRREAKIAGYFFLLLGIGGIAMGCLLFVGNESPASGTSCKAICGIALLVSEVFNPNVGRFIEGGLLLLAGLGFTFFGHLILKDTRKISP
ncbi:MAG: hypothetical protein LBJ15_24440 [Comamonas sp.]|jgi:hypothetical protein|uniref:hypothetical protein n=1 Tax=Comamonas sp. TaxID=34028 RepID=UPI002835F49B|nr:hypothetical protein [Comamonas sp.]MDR0217137.1 hypothetical protein [Comamonas sp.]MDR2298648.1 hypothetical protein [Comamonas sp.]